jgi:hypothetical protein
MSTEPRSLRVKDVFLQCKSLVLKVNKFVYLLRSNTKGQNTGFLAMYSKRVYFLSIPAHA